jgi:hypothetical protein
MGHADVAAAVLGCYGLMVMADGSRHELAFDGSFTVETGAHDKSDMMGVSLHPDGSLLFAKADGSQWQLSGNQLHTRAELEKKQVRGARTSSPARKLHSAKRLDQSINRGGEVPGAK